MTKPFLPVLLLGALLLAPLASAHGAPEARSIETRILADNDGWLTFAAPHEGHDLLALDIREAHYDGEPAIWFRYVWQAEADPAAAQDITDRILFEIDGASHTFTVTSDYEQILAHDFDAAFGPFPVQDGHPRALDLVVKYSTLGATPGDAVTGIVMESHQGDAKQEIMPGTYYRDGTRMQWLGDPTHAPDESPARWTLAGPAALLAIETPSVVEGINGSFNITIVNLLPDFEQFVDIDVHHLEGSQSLLLGPGERRNMTVTIPSAIAKVHADHQLSIASDLGGFAVASLHIMGSGEHDAHDHEEHAGGHHGDHMDGDHDHEDGHEHNVTLPPIDDQEAPGVPAVMLLVSLALVAIRRR